eukprot:CAMPEP_0117695980 /NCGR_PEP_ID=MMETSP0804-20121206/28436_1 /TAXON_ID=1074897 /ORGANISM="Tetraselmis astigmatica, Strain CCMP880" /LENGTH=75 /DNA_ID=CAMNT_0005510103 /DNA_START=20 /DNA_END=245 /DNA_ORIENTATION=+
MKFPEICGGARIAKVSNERPVEPLNGGQVAGAVIGMLSFATTAEHFQPLAAACDAQLRGTRADREADLKEHNEGE